MGKSLKPSAHGLHPLTDGLGGKRVNVVFIHGPSEDAQSAWTHAESGTYWPRDLLVQECSDVRILTYNYDASAEIFQNADALHEQAAGLVEGLAKIVQRGDSGSTVIFIAHGLGGLIAEQARILAYENVELRDKNFDLLRLGTPYFGSKEPSDDDLALVSRLSVVMGGEVKDPLATYKLWHGIQQNLSKKFVRSLSGGTSTYVASFYETESKDVNPSPLVPVDKSLFDGKTKCGHAMGGIGHHIYGQPVFDVQANHNDLGKFKDKDDKGFKGLLSAIMIYLDHAAIMENIALETASGQDWFG